MKKIFGYLVVLFCAAFVIGVRYAAGVATVTTLRTEVATHYATAGAASEARVHRAERRVADAETETKDAQTALAAEKRKPREDIVTPRQRARLECVYAAQHAHAANRGHFDPGHSGDPKACAG